MQFELHNKAILTGMGSETCKAIQQQLTILNPAFAEAERMGRWTGNIPRYLEFYEEIQNGLICPRGAVVMLCNICLQHGEQIQPVNNRLELDPVDFTFNGILRPYQQKVIAGVLGQAHGTLSAPTGSGKTCMGLSIIAQRNQPALIICHTKELQNQWISAIEKFLGIPADQVGVIGGGGKPYLGNKITVALVQSLYSRLNDATPYIGQVVVDECHHAPSRIFTQAVSAFSARYRLGLTATPERRDGLDDVIFWNIGPIMGHINKQDLLDAGNLCQGGKHMYSRAYRLQVACKKHTKLKVVLLHVIRKPHCSFRALGFFHCPTQRLLWIWLLVYRLAEKYLETTANPETIKSKTQITSGSIMSHPLKPLKL